MDKKTRDLIQAAYRKNRLTAVHIDMQVGYRVGEITELLVAVRDFSQALRKLNVPNIWVAYTSPDFAAAFPVTDYGTFKKLTIASPNALDGKLGALKAETVITKSVPSTFGTDKAPLHKHLAETGKDTILIDGFKANDCVGYTTRMGLLSGKYNIVAISDAMDMESSFPKGSQDYTRWMASIVGTSNKDAMHRFHTATSAEITQTLSAGP